MARITESRGQQLDVHDSLPLDFKTKVAEGNAASKQHLHPMFTHVEVDAARTPAEMVAEVRAKLQL
jgi:hypothetical protein